MMPRDVLDFWFKEAAGKWFVKDEAFDATVRERFLDTYNRAARGETAAWRATPEGRLAEIIVLDQFPRNMFRGTPQAFATDERALALAREAVARGDDRKLPRAQRRFLYMPYMHSESPEVHHMALALFWSLFPMEWRSLWFEYRHKAIVDRFGRYPHRNAILGRSSTPEERAFLATHPGF